MLKELWKTRPLESWAKCKELRLNAYREIANAHAEGKLVATGSVGASVILASGLGPYVHLGAEPYGASIATDPALSQLCTEAYEARNFARDTCSYFRNYLGSMWVDKFSFGGPFPRPDLIVTSHICDTHAKWFQVVAENFEIPWFSLEIPPPYHEALLEDRVEYMAGLVYDCIEWMEKTFHKKYDDERFIEAIHTECETESLFAEICYLNQAVPAPLDQKQLFTFYAPSAAFRYKKESVDFYRFLRDEVEDRVKNKIASVATERCRLIHDSQPPWYFMGLYRVLEQYGAVCVGSQYCFAFAHFEIDKDGIWKPAKTPRQLGLELKNRDDAVRYYARKTVNKPIWIGVFGMATDKSSQVLQIIQQWKANGLIIHLNRGCEGLAGQQLETKLACQQAGIPTMTYEGNMGDKREFDEAQTIDRLESFMENLGLKKQI